MTTTFLLRHGSMKFGLAKGTLNAEARVRFTGTEWVFGVRGTLDGKAFGWGVEILAAGTQLEQALHALFFYGLPPAVFADLLEETDQERYGAVAAWLRDPDLKPLELFYG